MHRKDYYAVLGGAKDADEREIKTAYRRLALLNHPDTNRDDPEAEDRFKEISEAYEVLSSEDMRSQYDLGRDPLSGSTLHPPPFDPGSDPFEEGCFPGARCRGGGLGRVLGRRRPGSRAHPPRFRPDVSDPGIHDLALNAEEALTGTERDIRIHTGPETLEFTVSIPAGAENGALLRFKQPVRDGQEIELLFRVKIA